MDATLFVQWVSACWVSGFSLIEVLDAIPRDLDKSWKKCAVEVFDLLETQLSKQPYYRVG